MKKLLFGKLSNGTQVHAYVLKGENIEAMILDYGAIIHTLKYKETDVVLGYDNMESYENDKAYLGAVVGRVANRIKGGKFKLNGKKYRLNKNEGKNTLHGGTNGFNSRMWTVEDYSDNELVLKRVSHHREEGFPGNLVVGVRYYIKGDTLGVEYTAVSDKLTVISLTNHTYFNFLGDEGVDNMFLSINADSYTPVGKDLIPTGKILPVQDTPMDFRWAKFVGRDIDADCEQLKIAGGYDHNYVLNGEGFREAAVLSCARKNILMSVYTDRPCVQLYTGNQLRGEVGKCGAVHSKRYGLCLETQDFPNAVNEKAFTTPILRVNDLYRTVTEYRFEDFIKRD